MGFPFTELGKASEGAGLGKQGRALRRVLGTRMEGSVGSGIHVWSSWERLDRTWEAPVCRCYLKPQVWMCPPREHGYRGRRVQDLALGAEEEHQ